jgi:pseudouridine-5'-monophosphatase
MKDIKITHVIYDVDGLLLDTERFYTEAYQIIAARYGKVFDWGIKTHSVGRRAEDSARIIIENLGLPLTVPEWLETRKALLEELFPKAEPLPGAVRLTRHLFSNGIPQAIATSSDRHYFNLKTSRHREWFSIFAVLVSGDNPEVKHGKPAPDIFRVTARHLGAQPERCLVFEDAPAGVEAARAADMFVVAVPDPVMGSAACSQAHEVLHSLAEFDPARWGLPPFGQME